MLLMNIWYYINIVNRYFEVFISILVVNIFIKYVKFLLLYRWKKEI